MKGCGVVVTKIEMRTVIQARFDSHSAIQNDSAWFARQTRKFGFYSGVSKSSRVSALVY